jgi:hypothetical protein
MGYYDYVERAYGRTFRPRDRVCHTPSGRHGEVMRPKPGYSHYVRVKFGEGGAGLCHPQELEPIAPPTGTVNTGE